MKELSEMELVERPDYRFLFDIIIGSDSFFL